MSHYTKLITKIKNRNSLVKTLERVGFKANQIEVHDEATNLYGYQGDKRNDKANVIIRRKHVGSCSNDIGFELEKDGTYRAVISDFDKGRYGDQWMKQVEEGYAIEQAKSAFAQEGWTVTESLDEKHQVQLVGVSYQ